MAATPLVLWGANSASKGIERRDLKSFFSAVLPLLASGFSCVVGNPPNRVNVMAYDPSYRGSLLALYSNFLKQAFRSPAEMTVGLSGRVAMKSGLLCVNAVWVPEGLKRENPQLAAAKAFAYSIPWTVFWRYMYNARVAEVPRYYSHSLKLLGTRAGFSQLLQNFITFAPWELLRVQVWLGLYLRIDGSELLESWLAAMNDSPYQKASVKALVTTVLVSAAETPTALLSDFFDVRGGVRGVADKALTPKVYFNLLRDTALELTHVPLLQRAFLSLFIKNIICNGGVFVVLTLGKEWIKQQEERSLLTVGLGR